MNENIGTMHCLVCNEHIPVKSQKNGKAMLNCGWCGFQGYARGDHADSLLRAKMKPLAAAVKQAVAEYTKPTDKPAASTKRAGILEDL